MSSRQPASVPKQSGLYHAVMTPIVFVSFIVSLAWVEFRYSMLRSHEHDGPASNPNMSSNKNSNTAVRNGDACNQNNVFMPGWLHSLVYCRQPYHYVLVKGDGDGQPAVNRPYTMAKTTRAAQSASNDGSYYHSMQRKLLKMESAEAFRIRTTVLWVMGLAVAGIAYLAMTGLRWLVGFVWR
ncbi:hypothetical protein SPBR_08699 [Sporothrix brasiliensis 5110]|uniref:Uncharacterized protein n=1 Tax=Sporothrix brasiliensis 5110 TaxID=1398154 RepID=A0A0C2F7D2_9PEZI|nr:uncharacterized protein SPBR_08699 [Sporothrix brasiliensis 5110]KIH86983.1 hypothetical protein SPBR_08699 [Sporothrix brasiliensis 5110]